MMSLKSEYIHLHLNRSTPTILTEEAEENETLESEITNSVDEYDSPKI